MSEHLRQQWRRTAISDDQAANLTWGLISSGVGRSMSVSEAEGFANRVLTEQINPSVIVAFDHMESGSLEDTEGTAEWVPDLNIAYIGLTSAAMHQIGVLHECAHVVAKSRGYDGYHGGPWVQAFRRLVFQYVGHSIQAGRKVAARPPAALFHYTSEFHLSAILAAGQLRLTESNIEMSGAGPGVVWLTSTADPGGNGLEGGLDKGAIRFTIPSSGLPIFHWPEWSREQGIKEFWYDVLAGASGGDPNNWWVCTSPIAGRSISRIERREGGRYVSIGENS